jgi:acyl dehydratase
MRYYEDITVGERVELGSHTVTKAEIREFAERYDPQPIHVDEAAAAESVYGGLIASGWHTAAVCMRLLAEGFLNETESMGSPGLDELRWLAPVRPGDTLSASVEILDTRPSESREDRGYVKNRLVGRNQEGDDVITWEATNIIGRRP